MKRLEASRLDYPFAVIGMLLGKVCLPKLIGSCHLTFGLISSLDHK